MVYAPLLFWDAHFSFFHTLINILFDSWHLHHNQSKHFSPCIAPPSNPNTRTLQHLLFFYSSRMMLSPLEECWTSRSSSLSSYLAPPCSVGFPSSSCLQYGIRLNPSDRLHLTPLFVCFFFKVPIPLRIFHYLQVWESQCTLFRSLHMPRDRCYLSSISPLVHLSLCLSLSTPPSR